MCSISGFLSSSPISSSLASLLTDGLLFYGRSRGKQSGGTCLIDPSGGAHLHKRALDPKILITDPAYTDMFGLDAFNDGVQAALCHTRTPTCGGLGDAQAQPFLIQGPSGPTITTHNGYYSDFDSIKAAHSITKPSGVDSELAASYVAAHGAETLPSFISTTDGPSSIACWHQGALYFIRSGNPLSYTFITLSDSTNLLIWASTDDILRKALSYVWLWDPMPTLRDTKAGILYKATSTTMKALTKTPTLHQTSAHYFSPSPAPANVQSSQHLCPYTNTTISMFSHQCKCQIMRSQDGTMTPVPNPRFPVPEPPAPKPDPTFEALTDLFASADFDDPSQDFWFSDAVSQLPETDRADFLARLTKAQTDDTSMTTDDWTILGRYWPLILEAASHA